MRENDFEDILERYPELIENGLTKEGRQVYVDGKYVDLIFRDRFGQKLIVELKIGAVKRKDVAQLLDYEGYFLSESDPTIRVMLIGNRVPENLRRSLDHHGFEWKEIQVSTLITFLKDKKDQALLDRLSKAKKIDETNISKPSIEFDSRNRQIGHRTGRNLFGTRGGTMANRFCQALVDSGKNGISMHEARHAEWNPKRYHFKETAARLIKEGLAEFRAERYYLTEKGKNELE
jgi:Endonuclease NucS C-terminal domain